ncbi:MAG: hypothetical protein ACKOCI_08975, partial [Cyanobium sp.]
LFTCMWNGGANGNGRHMHGHRNRNQVEITKKFNAQSRRIQEAKATTICCLLAVQRRGVRTRLHHG